MASEKPYKLASREHQADATIIKIGNTTIGGNELSLMGGPCAIESELQIHKIAAEIAKSGAKFLRGGAYKPRSSPYSFQGLGKEGLDYLQQAAHANQLYCISEIMDCSQLEYAANKLDVIQIGARNMYNYSLLKELGKINKPILLKRGLTATYQEFLLAAEYILSEGNANVILCERGIRSFETYTRNTLDLNAIPVLKSLSHLPVIIDPSHGTGRREMIAPMARAAVAAGADGLIIETHYDPDNAVSDAAQTIHTDTFKALIPSLHKIQGVLNPVEAHHNISFPG